MLHVQGLVKSYQRAGATVHAVDDCSFDVQRGELVVLRGRSGSGKSTLLNLIGLLAKPDAGSIELEGTRVDGLSEAAAADLRNQSLGIVFQAFNLVPHLTAVQNVALPVQGGRKPAELHATRLLERFQLGQRGEHLPSELSGGEQQRVAVARAIANSPALLIADEPTGNLDAASERLVLAQLRTAADEGCAVLVASHSDMVSAAGDRTIHMDSGRIVPTGVEGAAK